MGVGNGVWELFAEDGLTKVYRADGEVDGLVMDKFKVLSEVRGRLIFSCDSDFTAYSNQ